MAMNSSNRIWMIGAAVLSIAILAMGWFLGVAPKLAEASTAASDLATAQAANALQQGELAQIKKQYETLPAIKTQLAVLQQAIPADTELASFLGELHSLEVASGVTVSIFGAGNAQTYTPVTSTDKNLVTSNGLVTSDNFVSIAVNLTVTGDQPNLLDFVHALQNGPRLYLVSNLTVSPDPVGGKSSALITGYVYVVLDHPLVTAAAAAAPAPVATPSASPSAAASK